MVDEAFWWEALSKLRSIQNKAKLLGDDIEDALKGGSGKPRAKEKTAAAIKRSADVKELWDYYVMARQNSGLGGPLPKLSVKRKAAITARLSEFSMEDLKKAIDILLNTSYFWSSDVDFQGNQKVRMTSIDFVVRSTEQVEKLLKAKPIKDYGSFKKKSLVERRDGRVYYDGKRVFHASYMIPEELRATGSFIVMGPDDPRLKE